MLPIRGRLKKIDVYTTAELPAKYIGTKPAPRLIGFVYADVQPCPDVLSEQREGASVKQSARLFLREDAGVGCGDLVALYGNKPDCRITEVKKGQGYVSATAVRL